MENKKDKQSTYAVLSTSSIMCLLIYTLVEFIVSTITGVHHNVLTVCLYIMFGCEILLCSWAISKEAEDNGNE